MTRYSGAMPALAQACLPCVWGKHVHASADMVPKNEYRLRME
jgi:hypothetical protein